MKTKIWFLKVFDPIALCCYVTARCDYRRRRRRNDEKNVILPLKFSLKGALSHTVVPTLPWLLSHHIFGHIYIFTASFFLLLQACAMTWFQFSILTQNIVPWLSNFDSFFALLTFGDQVLKGVDETGGVSNNFGLIQVWGHTVWCGLVWTPKSAIFGEAFSTSLTLHIYHWRRLDTFDTILIVQNVCPRTPQG